MSDATPCLECFAIAEELKSAIAEVEASPKLRHELRTGRAMLSRMLEPGEDEQNIEEALERFPFRFQPGAPEAPLYRKLKLHDVFRKMFVHRMRSGHKIPFHV